MSENTHWISVRLTHGRGTKVHMAKQTRQNFMTLCGRWGNLAMDTDAGEDVITCKNCLRVAAAPYREREER